MLTEEERERYSRQMMIRNFGEEGQEKLKRAKVIVAGSGGLGSPISIYLAAAGVGTIRLIDFDHVELTNLNRQVLHWDKDVGRQKVESASEKLRQLNRHVRVETLEEKITESSVTRMVAGFDLIIDAMDNLPTRFVLNKAAVDTSIPFIHGAVYGFEGRAMTILPGKTACLRCVYRGLVPQEKFPVIGVTPAVIGCIEAAEAIKYLVGMGKLLTDRLLVYDGLNMKFTEMKVHRDPRCPHCGHLTGDS